MKKWVVRFVSLLVFNVVVLLIIGWLTPARVGWAAIWAGIILTAATIWIKPLITKWFQSMAARSAGQRTKAGEKVVQFFLVLLVAFIVWILTVLLSGVSAGNWFWGYILPPVILVIGWAIYDAIDDRVEAHAGALYDRATGSKSAPATAEAAAVPSPEAQAGARELKDGLTDEQRKMLDELG
ncbi:hypothetical protein GCM10009775_19580 [Microbacterium aoyamense]|uniref:Phage holin family protein n=1 Tax=Microbacterium aoyamense TaxID=344166 RepID=A0ABN2PQX1_9MICO|nr:hypothetical protein [Microbacterium aoyamense]